MYYYAKIAILSCLMAISPDSLRASDFDPLLNLDAYVRFAIENNPGLERSYARLQAALASVSPARAPADPRLSYGYFVEAVETRVGPQQMRFGAAQTFPWVGTLNLRGRIAEQEAEVEAQRYEAARQALIFRVKEAYLDYYYLQRALTVTESNLDLLAYSEEVGRTRYRGGIGAHAAVLKAQVELGRLAERLHSLRQRQRPVAARLNAALGRDVRAAVAVPDSLPPLTPIADSLAAELLMTSPALQIARAQAQAADLAVELASKRYYPKLTLTVDYLRTGLAQSDLPDSGKDPLVAMATVELPLWRGVYRAEEDMVRAHRRAAQYAVRDEEILLIAELETALYKSRDAESRTELYQKNLLPKAEQAYNVAQQAFAAGRSDFLSLVDAQRTLLEFQLAYERARTDQALAVAEIEALVGGTKGVDE